MHKRALNIARRAAIPFRCSQPVGPGSRLLRRRERWQPSRGPEEDRAARRRGTCTQALATRGRTGAKGADAPHRAIFRRQRRPPLLHPGRQAALQARRDHLVPRLGPASARSLAGAARRQTTVELRLAQGRGRAEEAAARRRRHAPPTTSRLPAEVPGRRVQSLRVTATRAARPSGPSIVSALRAAAAQEEARVRAQGVRRRATRSAATVEVKRPTGEPLAGKHLTGVVTRRRRETAARARSTTNAEGNALVRFELPQQIERGDGLLTILVEDGGVTESISKRDPDRA